MSQLIVILIHEILFHQGRDIYQHIAVWRLCAAWRHFWNRAPSFTFPWLRPAILHWLLS